MKQTMEEDRLWVTAVWLGLSLWACAGGGKPDAGITSDAGDGGADGFEVPDFDRQNQLALFVPEGVGACSLDLIGMAESDIEGTVAAYRKFTRLELESGLHAFPKDSPSAELDLVKRVLVGSQGEVAQPENSGTISQEIPGTAERTFRQFFECGGKPYRLEIHFDFTEPLVVLDDAGWYRVWFSYRAPLLTAIDGSEQSTRIGPCALPAGWEVSYQISISGGATLELTKPYLFEGLLCPAILSRGVYRSGSGDITVTERGRLIHTQANHSYFQNYLVVLEPPAGLVHGVHVYFTEMSEPQEVHLLGADLSLLETLPVTGFSKSGPSCFDH